MSKEEIVSFVHRRAQPAHHRDTRGDQACQPHHHAPKVQLGRQGGINIVNCCVLLKKINL